MDSLMPYYYRTHPFLHGGDWWNDLTPARLFDQEFGVPPYWLRPHRTASMEESDVGLSEYHNDKDKFSVNLDVSHFRPEEINVKTTDTGLIITGEHEERMDPHGFVSRKFTRRYALPKDVDPATLISQLTTDGVLCVEAPKHELEATNERHIPIQRGVANPAAIEHKKKAK